ncbi:hypothetical protein ACIRCZ_04565 [Leifsonia sp. NPDC102414]|uniref:hypothetical protein n=1 Tax=Leifsonia sp. NPDC102414 TaxID=3364124 RepID=UPI003830E15B
MSGQTPGVSHPAPDAALLQETAPSRRLLFAVGLRWRIAGCVLLAVVVGFLAWFFGLDVEHAAGLAAVLLAVVVCMTLLGDQAFVGWAPDPVLPRDGARRDVSQLGWALHTKGGGVAPEAVRRLRSVTAQTLDLHGLDLDAPADAAEIARILGKDTVRLLRRGSAESPKAATYEAIIDRLAHLADAPVGPLDATAAAGPDPSPGPLPTAPAASTVPTPPQEPHP